MPSDDKSIHAIIELVRDFAPKLPNSVEEARLTTLPDAGLTSMGAVKLMLALEAAYDVAIPDEELTPENFRTVEAIDALVSRLKAA